MQSIYDQLLHESSSGRRELRNLKFIWVERDPVLVQQVEFVKCKEKEFNTKGKKRVGSDRDQPEHSHRISGNITSLLLAMIPPGKTTDAELEEQYTDGGLPNGENQLTIEHDVETPSCQQESPSLDINLKAACTDDLSKPGSEDLTRANKKLEQVPDMQIYLTGNAPPFEKVPFARFWQAGYQAFFEEMRKDATASGDKKVAVCVFAPQNLVSLCRGACVLYSDGKVGFDFHSGAMAS